MNITFASPASIDVKALHEAVAQRWPREKYPAFYLFFDTIDWGPLDGPYGGLPLPSTLINNRPLGMKPDLFSELLAAGYWQWLLKQPDYQPLFTLLARVPIETPVAELMAFSPVINRQGQIQTTARIEVFNGAAYATLLPVPRRPYSLVLTPPALYQLGCRHDAVETEDGYRMKRQTCKACGFHWELKQ